MRVDQIQLIKGQYEIYGDPYRAFVPGVLFSSSGDIDDILIPVDLGRRGATPEDLYTDEWLGLRRFQRNTDEHVTKFRVMANKNYHFYHHSQDSLVRGPLWHGGVLASLWFGDIVGVHSDDNKVVLPVSSQEKDDMSRLLPSLYPSPTLIYARLSPFINWGTAANRPISFLPLGFDLINEMVTTGTYQNAMKLAKVQQSFRFVVQRYIRSRVCRYLTPFVSSDYQASFLEHTAKSGGFVVGNVPTAIMTFETPPDYNSYELHIIVGRGKAQDMVRFFTHTLPEASGEGAFGPVQKAESHRGGFRSIHYLGRDGRRVVVFESSHQDVLLASVSSPDTGYMNILTVNELVSVYPRLLRDLTVMSSKGIRGRAPTPSAPMPVGLDKSVLKFAKFSSHLDDACGTECPLLWRSFAGLQGIGVFNWIGVDDSKRSDYSLSDYMLASTIGWRFGLNCANQKCATSGVRV
ncbi:hypothetical protein C8J56DRAFT_1041987 [Mycena floridula]|nr:hypothetical protein C8J56DRAFT_1041987 [Mycena floridula]